MTDTEQTELQRIYARLHKSREDLRRQILTASGEERDALVRLWRSTHSAEPVPTA